MSALQRRDRLVLAAKIKPHFADVSITDDLNETADESALNIAEAQDYLGEVVDEIESSDGPFGGKLKLQLTPITSTTDITDKKQIGLYDLERFSLEMTPVSKMDSTDRYESELSNTPRRKCCENCSIF